MSLDPHDIAYGLAEAGWDEGADAIRTLTQRAEGRTNRDYRIRSAALEIRSTEADTVPAAVYIARVRQLVDLILDEESA